MEVLYIGSEKGPEAKLCARYGIPFRSIATGKLRRYFAWENFTDPFRVIKGVYDAWNILREWRPDVVFSKGGFVSAPVVLAAARLGVPVILHEADVTPGLANKFCARFAKVVCVSWEETMTYFPDRVAAKKILLTGMPVRRELASGVAERGREFLGFDGRKPILLVMGGSLGAASVNALVRKVLPKLLKDFDVVHVVGAGVMKDTNETKNVNDMSNTYDVTQNIQPGYRAFPYLQDELFDVYACSDVVVSRAGASALAELCVLGKPSVLIPLGSSQSRGDQIVNAEILSAAGAAEVYVSDWSEPSKFIEMVCVLGHGEEGARKRSALSKGMQVFGARHRRAAGQIAEVIMGVFQY